MFTKIKRIIDDFLNRTTMYRVVQYYLIGLLFAAVSGSIFNLIPYSPAQIIFSTLFLYFFSGFISDVFSHNFKAPTNLESATITVLILALVIPPAKTLSDFIFLGWAAILAMSSKYILVIGKKHIFNPVAIAIALTAIGIYKPATWWIGNPWMMPFVLLGGLLVVRKIRRESMMFAFFLTVFIISSAFTLMRGSSLIVTYQTLILHSSLLFFAFAMITEPLTSPHTGDLRVIFAVLVGFLFIPNIHIGSLYSTPEIALLVGNIFSYIVSPKEKFIWPVTGKVRIAPDMYDFVFPLKKNLSYIPGQYMEWTLPHARPDNRGTRRYFTLASSPTEPELRIGVKIYEPSSTYKQALLHGDTSTMVAGQRSGDFVLPDNTTEKLVFLAGGIGITPFRSMLKYLIDTNQKRDITVLYFNRHAEEIVYQDILNQAYKRLGVRVYYALTDKEHAPLNWQGALGRLDATMLQTYVPDAQDRLFYLSGPPTMIDAFEMLLKSTGIAQHRIKKDFFPGFA
jgi:ferredoxin-NADP reductase/Na+-translocating ferredoxin:NAD+ oxidoreductase RnfD subunit